MATASAEMDPCIFPKLGAARTASSRHDTYVQTLVLPNFIQQNAAFPKDVDLESIFQFGFALLVKAYTRSNDVAFGLIHDPSSEGSKTGRSTAAATAIRIYLDEAATLLEHMQKLSHARWAGPNRKEAKRDDLDVEKLDTSQFNTALRLTPHGSPTKPIQMALDMALVLQVLNVESMDVNSRTAEVILHFSTDYCDQWSAQNVVATFESILATLAAGLQYPLSKMDPMSVRDREQIRAWNKKIPPPACLTLNESLEKVFQQNADKEAVYTTHGSFTYGQLDDLSTILASRLIELGVKPNMVVPICMDKSRWVTCAMIAVWKAGGALTAIDPAHPDERLFSIVEELNAKILICDRAYAPRFQGRGLQVVADVEALTVTQHERITPVERTHAWRMSKVAPSDLAFVVFTSGSTGKPKGVLNTHDRATTELQWFQGSMGFSKDARVLLFASYAFVPGTADNYRTLLHGATLCIPSEVERTSDLVGFIRRSRSSRVLLTPSLLRTLDPADIPDVRDVLAAGEPASRDIEGPWSKGRHFVQSYGSTEGGAWIKETVDSVSRTKGLRPCPGDQWLVDQDNVDRLVPVGATGEIVLESHGTSIGYLNDPAKTAHTFLTSPAWADEHNVAAGCKYLRLGDLGRYESDGSITVYGRADTQVKIHGQRVDLQDVESNLRPLLPAGSEAVVDLVKPFDAPDRPLLTAFCQMVRTSNERKCDFAGTQSMLAALQNDLRKTLPQYMVPKIFITTNKLPQNLSHKIDRKKLRTDAEKMGYKALAAHMPNLAAPDEEDLANDRERIIAQSWASVLHHELHPIKRQDSFLALGGDSLAAIKLVPILRSRSLSLTTLDILSHPVLKDMAELAIDVDETALVDGESDATLSENTTETLQATDFQEWAALVGAREGGWIDHFIYDFSGSLHVDRLRDCCKRLVAAHSILRTIFTHQDQRVVMHISPETNIRFDVHRASTCELEDKSQEICAKDRIRGLGAPIVRFDLITTSTTRNRLIVRLSHAQYDAFTARNVGEHLRLLYLSQPLPRTLPFYEYVKRIQEPGLVQRAEKFWKSSLQGSEMPRLVKRAKAGPPFNHPSDEEVYRSIEVPHLQHRGINSAALVKTAWTLVVSSLSQATDVVFGNVISGRQVPIPGIETVFGPCLNFTPVRVRLEPGLTNIELLQRVQEHLIQAIPHESLGMRHIIERCTDWGPHARYSSIVNFINVESSSDCMSWDADDTGEHLEVTRSYEEQQHDKTDLWLLCLRKGGKSGNASTGSFFDLFFRYSTIVYQRSAIDKIAEMYCNVMVKLVTDLDATVSTPWVEAEERTHLVPYVAF